MAAAAPPAAESLLPTPFDVVELLEPPLAPPAALLPPGELTREAAARHSLPGGLPFWIGISLSLH